ncbi:MAG: T9SS type A sorting domain-containing protein, partial [Bacteroidota bacterium]
LTGYDVYELESSLEGIVLQYSAAHETDWHLIDTLEKTDLVDYYVANRSAYDGNVHYAFTWTPALVDGSYAVRAVAYGEFGFPEYSGEASGIIDTQSPWVLNITPGDDVIGIGESLQLTFTEAIAPESLTGEAFSLRERVITTPLGGGDDDTTFVKLPEAMYRMEAGGSDITFHFDADFNATYDGATLTVFVDSITDRASNVMDSAFARAFAVENVSTTQSRMTSLELAGMQREDGTVQLSWQQIDAEGNLNYLIERSADGDQFEVIGSVLSSHAESFGYHDETVLSDQAFYRLRIQRSDATEAYSRVAVIQDAGLALPLSVDVHPNPISGSQLRFVWDSKGSDENLTLEVRDLRGALLYTETVDATTRGLQQSVKLPEHLETGLYMMHLTQGNQTQSVKFIKE